MKKHDPFDFWHAVNNTEIVVMPSHHLETFGSTILNYHLVSELMDSVNQIRVREGRMQASQPKIITPEAYSETLLEGFGAEAARYMDWLKEHEREIKVLQYGYRLKQQSFSEHIVTDNMESVIKKVEKEVRNSEDPLSAVVVGVDSPWDVCLVKLFWEIIQTSAGPNLQEFSRQAAFEKAGRIPPRIRREVEAAFLAASKNHSRTDELVRLLQGYNLFDQYQDRFFSLVKENKKG